MKCIFDDVHRSFSIILPTSEFEQEVYFSEVDTLEAKEFQNLCSKTK